MSLRLILMRHAKSSWDDPLQSDHDRPLNSRGQRSAQALGGWLREKGHAPNQALVSTSQRTRETFQRLALPTPAAFFDGLYHAPAARMLDTLRLNASGNTVLLIGHNPGCADFAAEIVAAGPGHARFFDYPTAATLIVDLPGETWPDVRFGTGDVVDFITPRELIG